MKLKLTLALSLMLILMLGLAPMMSSAQSVPVPDDDTLVIAINGEPGSMDPSQVGGTTGGSNFRIMMHTFATLYELGQASGAIDPYLAHSFTVSDDGTEWTFHMHEGLTCDDGEPLTAEDAAYSFNRMADPANGFTGNSAGFVVASTGFVEARADSELDVTIVARKPQNRAMRLGLYSEVLVHCKDSYEAMSFEEAARNVVGSGPYSLAEWVPGEYMSLKAVKGFGLRPQGFENLVWRFIPEPSTAVAEVITGNVDIYKEFPANQAEAIRNSGMAEARFFPGTTRTYIGFNLNPDAPFRVENPDDVGAQAIMRTDVRVALQYAIDTDAICENLLLTTCVRATSLVNPSNADHPTLEPYPYDPAKAEELLDAAGYPRGEDGVRFSLEMPARRLTGAMAPEVVLATAQMLTDVGVQTEAIFQESGDWVAALITHDLGPLYFGRTGGSEWSAQYDMADIPGHEAGCGEAETNYTNWDNDFWCTGWDTLPSLTGDPEAERELEIAMLEEFYNDPPWIMLFAGPRTEAVSNRIEYQSRADYFITGYSATLKDDM
ncbi:MAG: ABC transporter substrate-binding protein [Chloroflexota bacterium]|nr:ABC transporter substrate-binding protein [Chloroflexota bacterium]